MAFNVITFLQMAVFVVILFNINLHSASAGSKEKSGSQVSETSITGRNLRYKLYTGDDDKTWRGGQWADCVLSVPWLVKYDEPGKGFRSFGNLKRLGG
uniref:Putative secreted protein n=1 Tax=Ixodes ricinus TaxID=34613 RepID=A0A0K8RDM8_IXORI